jgi:hypothetical protein
MTRVHLLLLAAAAVQVQGKITELDPKIYPRNFAKIPIGTEYGTGEDDGLNHNEEDFRIEYLEKSLGKTLKKVTEVKGHPTFTTALIAGTI